MAKLSRVSATERTHKLPTQLGAVIHAVSHLVLNADQNGLLQRKIPGEAATQEHEVS